MNRIGTLGEKSLHADLKDWYAEPNDGVEVLVDGFHIDLVRDDELIEIQTANFYAIKSKLAKLLVDHKVRLIYPIARERWIVRVDKEGHQLKRRKSPKRGKLGDLFDELVSMPALVPDANLVIEVLLIQDEIVWMNDGRGSWRRKGWSLSDRRLLSVLESRVMKWPQSYKDYVPASLASGFTNRDLAKSMGSPVARARKITYCLSRMGVISCIGHRDRYKVYSLNEIPI